MSNCVWAVRPEDRMCRYCKMVNCVDRDRTGAKKLGTITPRIRALAVGDRMEVSYASKDAAKMAIFRLKRELGARYATYSLDKSLFIERIS